MLISRLELTGTCWLFLPPSASVPALLWRVLCVRSEEPRGAAAPRPNALLVCQRSFLARVEQTPALPGLESHQRLWKTLCVLSGRKQGAPPAPSSWQMLCEFDRMVQVSPVDRASELMAGQTEHLCPLGWQQ